MTLRDSAGAVTPRRAARYRYLYPKWRCIDFPSPLGRERRVQLGTKTITMYVSDLDQSEIPAGEAYQLSIRHPDGSTQQLDISEKNYRDLKLAGVGKTLKKRGRKAGSTAGTGGAPRRRRPRQTSEPPVTA
jgi:hypothetical protein